MEQKAAIPGSLIKSVWRARPDAEVGAYVEALLLRDRRAGGGSAARPSQYTKEERRAQLLGCFKPLAELASASDADTRAVLASVKELATSLRVDPARGGASAGGASAGGDRSGRGGGRGGGHGRGGGSGRGSGARRFCSCCRKEGHNRTTCPARAPLYSLGTVGGDEPLALPPPPPLLIHASCQCKGRHPAAIIARRVRPREGGRPDYTIRQCVRSRAAVAPLAGTGGPTP
jgi:hypothetical protein